MKKAFSSCIQIFSVIFLFLLFFSCSNAQESKLVYTENDTIKQSVKEIEQKARKVMGMLKRGVKFTPTQPDVMKIIENLTEK